MRTETNFTKTDLIVTLLCAILLLINLGTIGAGGRQRAKEAVCRSNLKQWGICFSQYVSDNNGYFDIGNNDVSMKWMNSLKPYYKKPKLRVCPTAAKFWCDHLDNPHQIPPYENNPDSPFTGWYLTGGNPDRWDYIGNRNYGSYGSNSYIYNRQDVLSEYRQWKTINTPGTENIPMLLDSLHIGGQPDITDALPLWNGEWSQSMGIRNAIGRYAMDRHAGAQGGGTQGVFMDLSVQKIGVKRILRLKWHREYNINDPDIPEGNEWPGWMRDYPDF